MLKNNYPSKEEILKTPFKFTPEVLTITANWKKIYLENIKKKTESDKTTEIKILLYLIAGFTHPAIRLGTKYSYDNIDKVISLDKDHASVISALHELGHHLYGDSELEACRFSVWLFKTIFPEFYEKLNWVGHLLLVKK